MNILLVLNDVSYMRECGQWRECQCDNGYTVRSCSRVYVNDRLKRAKGKGILKVKFPPENRACA